MLLTGLMLLSGREIFASQAHGYRTGMLFKYDSGVQVEAGSKSGDSTQKVFDATGLHQWPSDSMKKTESTLTAAPVVVPREWQQWVHNHHYTPKESTQKEGFVREGKETPFTVSFLLLILGLLLIAADRQRYVHMSRAFLLPRLFEQFLRQQSGGLGSVWAISRFVCFKVLLATCLALYRYRMELSSEPITTDGLYIFGITLLASTFFLLLHLLIGLIFDRVEWTLNHVQTTWVYFQFMLPLLLVAVLLSATLPSGQLFTCLLSTAALLTLGWLYRLVLGWIRALNTRSVGLGYIIFYFCTIEILPLLLLIKFTTIYFDQYA